MKTVLHLERKFTWQTETFIVNQINALKQYRSIVYAIQNLQHLPCKAEIHVPQHISLLSKSAKLLSYSTAHSIRNSLIKEDFDLIHAHYLVDAVFFHKVTKYFSKPKLCSAYGYDVTHFPNQHWGIPRLLLKTIFKEYDLFLAMSEDMKEDLLRLNCPEEKILIHYHGINTAKFFFENRDYYSNGSIRILSVGTIEEKKAQHLVVEALGLLLTKYRCSNFEYHIVGDGNFLNVVRNKIDECGLSGKVFLHGHVPYEDPRLLEFYKNADIFTLPSATTKNYDKEGIPGVIVEAMASGLPVVSTYHAGIPSIIENEKEGLLVEEKNIDLLAKALYRLISSPELRETLGKNAQRKAIDTFDLDKATERLETIYGKLIGRVKTD